jgi:NAD+ kinase
MTMTFNKVAIIGRRESPDLLEPITDLALWLMSSGRKVRYDMSTGQSVAGCADYSMSYAELGEWADVAIVIGGDGTMLGFAREVAKFGIPLIGVNRGRVGFITDIPLADMCEAVEKILAGSYVREERALLGSEVVRDGIVIHRAQALNDVTVTRAGVSGMVELSVSVDRQFMYEQRSDGLIVSTPTGSSAYSLSAGGPLLHPRLRSVVITPIAPQKLSNRPIVLPGDSRVEIKLVDGKNINVHSDMQTYTELRVGDIVRVTRSPQVVPFLHPEGYDYYATLREKLHWNE